MQRTSKSSLLGMDRQEVTDLVLEAGQPVYRAKQIMEAVYRQRVETLDDISTLPQEFRERMVQSGVEVGAPKIEKKFVSVDGTVRYLIGFADGQSVETVWMPEGDGGEAGDGSEAGEEAEISGMSTAEAEAHNHEDPSSQGSKRGAPKIKAFRTRNIKSPRIGLSRIPAVPQSVFRVKWDARWIVSSA